MTQARSQGPESPAQPRSRPRPAGPYLQRRGRTFYFRKRLPKKIAEKSGIPFLRLSLRTDLLADAMGRAARLLSVAQAAEKRIMIELTKNAITPAEIDLVLGEALRSELNRIMTEQAEADLRSDAEIEARIAALEAEIRDLKRAARRNDFEKVQPWCAIAAETLDLALPAELPVEMGRQALALRRDLAELEAKVADGEEASRLAEPLVARVSTAPVETFIEAPLRVSDCRKKAGELYPTPSMQAGMDATLRLVTELVGDVPMDLLTEERQKEFFLMLSRLPKNHGKKHGKNRFRKEGKIRSKREEIEAADAADALVTEEIRARDDLSLHEKRALLAEKLTPRVTYQNIKKHRDVLHRFNKAARAMGAATTHRILGYRELEALIAASAPDDALYLRVTKPKTRMPWTQDRIADMLTSPIYRGCASPHRRWMPGTLLIRDATYWVPLIRLTTGSRLDEILMLKRRNIVLHKGVTCLAIGFDPDQRVKTEAGRRYLPVPQFLLDLGFLDWVRGLPEDHGLFLFPEALERSEVGKAADAFGKHLKNLFSKLGLADFDEDFYALRLTLGTALSEADVADGKRKAILGQRQQDILNRHYTAQKAPLLKNSLDRLDFGAQITFSERYGCPVIANCARDEIEAFEVDLTLDESGAADILTIRAAGAPSPAFQARVAMPDATVGLKPDDGLPLVDIQELGRRFRDIVGRGRALLPRNPEKRRLVEHICALA